MKLSEGRVLQAERTARESLTGMFEGQPGFCGWGGMNKGEGPSRTRSERLGE